MAVNIKDYNIKIDVGIWTNKEYSKFLLYFKFKNKKYKKVLDYRFKTWDKRTKIKEAKNHLFNMKCDIENEKERVKESKLNEYAFEYFSRQNKSSWQKQKESFYNKYIKNEKIGNYKLHEILKKDIENLISKHSEMSERTKKYFTEILNPIFKDAIDNRICIYNPCENIVFKLPKTKKIILNAKDELKVLINAIEELYKDNDYLYCLFMFYLLGRRKSEVLKMEWKNIDIENNFYVIEDVKNGENQKFHLDKKIKEKIIKIPKINKYVFASKNKKNDHIKNLSKHIKDIRDKTKTDFKLKDTRNIITSAMGEDGKEAIYQSGAVGHKSLKTIDKYSTLNYVNGSRQASELINKIN